MKSKSHSGSERGEEEDEEEEEEEEEDEEDEEEDDDDVGFTYTEEYGTESFEDDIEEEEIFEEEDEMEEEVRLLTRGDTNDAPKSPPLLERAVLTLLTPSSPTPFQDVFGTTTLLASSLNR